MRKFILFISCITAAIAAIGQNYTIEVINAAHTISSHELMKHVEEMCHPKYEGRGAGSPGYDSIASWVANNLQQWGLKPAGDNGTYFQKFSQPYTHVFTPGVVELVTIEDGDTLVKPYTIPDEYFPGSNSDSGNILGEVVFVGYGISAPELGYDDYNGIDVSGKIAH